MSNVTTLSVVPREKTHTVSFQVMGSDGLRVDGEYYGFKTKAAAKGYLTRVMNKRFGKGEWGTNWIGFYYE